MTDDKILLAELCRHNIKAFDLIFNKYFNRIYFFILNNCRSDKDAEDLAQEVFIKLWENRDTIVSIKGYLYTIAKGLVVDWIRKKVNKMIFASISDALYIENEDDIIKNIETKDLLELIQEVLKSMPNKQLDVYKMRWIEGLSRKEIADRMGITITTVDIHLRKGLVFLRKNILKKSN